MSRDFIFGLIAGLVIAIPATAITISLVAPIAPGPEVPTEAEAMVAMRKEKAAAFPNLALKFGQFDKDTMSPVVRCTVDVNFAATGNPKSAIVGFSKGRSGWVSVHYL